MRHFSNTFRTFTTSLVLYGGLSLRRPPAPRKKRIRGMVVKRRMIVLISGRIKPQLQWMMKTSRRKRLVEVVKEEDSK